MSAFAVSDKHLSYLVSAANGYGVLDHSNLHADAAFAMLRAENNASVAARYPGAAEMLADAGDFTWVLKTDPVQVLKAVRCYEYQACEHDGWETSKAKKFCATLTAYAIAALPGYQDAAWEVA